MNVKKKNLQRNVWEWVFDHIENQLSTNSFAKLRDILEKEDFTLIRRQIKEIYPELLGYPKKVIDRTKKTVDALNLDENDSDNEVLTEEEYSHQKELLIDEIIRLHQSFIFPKLKGELNVHTNFGFCTELKQFYVMITRPKTFLLFYEENSIGLKILNYLIKIGLVVNNNNNIQEPIVNNNIQEPIVNNNIQEPIEQTISDFFYKAKLEMSTLDTFIKAAEAEFNKKHYERAAFLFRKVNQREKALIAEIYQLWEEIKLYDNSYIKNEIEFRAKNNHVLDKIDSLTEKFDDKEGIKGDCLYNLGHYEEAIKAYTESEKYDRCGYIYYFHLKKYKLAYENYKKVDNYTYCFLSLEEDKNYKELINYTNVIANKIGIIGYVDKYKKYINLYWEKIIPQPKRILTIGEDQLNSYSVVKSTALLFNFDTDI